MNQPEKANFKEPENSQEHPAPFTAALLDMLRIGVPRAMYKELVETFTGNTHRMFGYESGVQAVFRDDDHATDAAYNV